MMPGSICETLSGYWVQLCVSQYKKHQQLEQIQPRANKMVLGQEHRMNEERLKAGLLSLGKRRQRGI